MSTHLQKLFEKKSKQVLSLLLLQFCFIIGSVQATTTGKVTGKNGVPLRGVVDIFVSPRGSDNNPGTLQKPFATIQKAQMLARKIHQPVTVYLRAGTYYLNSTVLFTAEDSRPANAPLVFRAYQNEKPVISGSNNLKLKWEQYQNGIMQAKVNGDMQFDELFVNRELQHSARYPNYKAIEKHYNGYAADALDPVRVGRWKNPVGGFIHALHRSEWGDMAYHITGKDANGKLSMEGGWQNNRPSGMHGKYRFVENIFEELDTVNEWYYDKQSHILYFYPQKGTDLNKALIETPQIEALFSFKGNEKKPVTNISIAGLELTHTLRTFMKNKEQLLRSDWTIYRVGAVTMEGTEFCSIKNSKINSVGGNAIVFSNYNRNSEISGSSIMNTGSSAVVFVGDPAAVRSPLFRYEESNKLADIDKTPGPKTNNYPTDCKVYNNLIQGVGRVEKQVAGVQLSMCMNINVSHNTINDLPRSGINVSEGTWGGHIIEYNDVFDAVQETGDHGSFNSWGRDRFWFPDRKQMDSINLVHPELVMLDVIRPIIIRNNRFRCDHGWDIDLDDGSSNYEIYNNLCLNGGIKLREGFNRKVYNNVIVNNSFHPHVWFQNSNDTFQHNIVSNSYFPIGIKFWGDKIDLNLFPDSLSLNKTRKNNTDLHSAYGDPIFINPQDGDFRVSSNSPALKIGFKNFAMDNFGVVSPLLKALSNKVVIPPIVAVTGGNAQKNIDFLGAKVKNLNTLGERSATGMASETGVLVLEVPQKSQAYGKLMPNDVILKVGDNNITDIKSLANAAMSLQLVPDISLQIFRNQSEQKITIKLR